MDMPKFRSPQSGDFTARSLLIKHHNTQMWDKLDCEYTYLVLFPLSLFPFLILDDDDLCLLTQHTILSSRLLALARTRKKRLHIECTDPINSPTRSRSADSALAMDMAKSFFGTRDHEGYVGKQEHDVSNLERNPIPAHF